MHFGLLKARGFISAVTGQYNISLLMAQRYLGQTKRFVDKSPN